MGENNPTCTVCFLDAISFISLSYRYYAVFYPLSARSTKSADRTKKIIAATWVAAVVLCIPFLSSTSYPFNINSDLGSVTLITCNDNFDAIDGGTGELRTVFFILLFLIMYFIPSTVIIVTCTKLAIRIVQPFSVDLSYLTRSLRKRRENNKRKVGFYLVCFLRNLWYFSSNNICTQPYVMKKNW